jgi:phospholipid/cholesterol/gamma-HCH transport system ATP-binding protein
MEAAIRVVSVRKTFNSGRDFVLKGLSLDIPKGKITVIIGFSGTGKSVLLKHMLGLLKPTDGFVEVLGENISSLSEAQLIRFRRRFGVLFQNAALFDDMTSLENVCFPLREHRPDLSPAEIKSLALAKLEMVGMELSAHEKLPSALSGGMRKRVGLARALALDPEILFYDEPTTGLDPIRTEMVDNLIYDTHHRGAHTSVVISHDLDAAFRIADYVAMLDSGEVVLFGTPEEFRASNIELVRMFIAKGLRDE